jgi:hypothetical protein
MYAWLVQARSGLPLLKERQASRMPEANVDSRNQGRQIVWKGVGGWKQAAGTNMSRCICWTFFVLALTEGTEQ